MANERVLLRVGTGAQPPVAMQPGEIAYSPGDDMLWLAGFDGTPVQVMVAGINALIAAQLASLVLDGGTF